MILSVSGSQSTEQNSSHEDNFQVHRMNATDCPGLLGSSEQDIIVLKGNIQPSLAVQGPYYKSCTGFHRIARRYEDY